MRNLKDFIAKKTAEYGVRLRTELLAAAFRPYFETGDRIKVLMSYGETYTGTVGVTTGYWPTFLLMRRRNDSGSSITLGDRDTVVAVKCGRKYTPVVHDWNVATNRTTCGKTFESLEETEGLNGSGFGHANRVVNCPLCGRAHSAFIRSCSVDTTTQLD